jgi:hypothetical protein
MLASMDNAIKLAASLEGAPALQEVGVLLEPRVVCVPLSYSHLYFPSMSDVVVISFST